VNTKIQKYIKVCSLPALMDLFDAIINEMNKRKEKEQKDNGKI
jgi:hypothetical protein